MPEYRVSWVIDVVTDNPCDAAEAARAAQVRAGTLATVFTVAERLPGGTSRYGPSVEVDLEPGDTDKLTALMDSITRADTAHCGHASTLRPVDLCRECGAILADGVELDLSTLTTGELPGPPMTGWFITAGRRDR
ncbi:MAG: hypothetical protein ACRDRU_17605 [Pseudonocardiaceae bacterium]